jgi:hypothetical protein
MFDVKDLTTDGRYHITNERGEWHYSGNSGNKYNFWRWAEGQTNRRVSLALSKVQVQRKVWQEVQRLNLANLEAFRGE